MVNFSETQVSNKLYKDALNSLNKAQKINPNISEIYFAKSNILKFHNFKMQKCFRNRIKH